MTDIRHLLQIAEQAALEAAGAVMKQYQSGDYGSALKPDQSPVTKADTSAHSIIIQHLSKTHLPVISEEGINLDFSERKSWENVWLVDPLDGTKEFIHQNGEFTINIALVQRGIPIAGVIDVPCTDVLYYGSRQTGVYKNERGRLVEFAPLAESTQLYDLLQKDQITAVVSRSHPSAQTQAFLSQFRNVVLQSLGSSLKFISLLENKADIYPRFGSTMEWDTAAAHAILNAANRGVYKRDLKSELMYNKADLTNPFFIAF